MKNKNFQFLLKLGDQVVHRCGDLGMILKITDPHISVYFFDDEQIELYHIESFELGILKRKTE